MISRRDGAARYLKTRRVWPTIGTGRSVARWAFLLSLYSKVYGAVAATRFAWRARRITTSLAREVES
jgi:hypothetical protein